MPVVDIAILAIVLFSIVVSVIRGFAREAMSLITWIVAIWVSFQFSPQLAPFFEPYIPVPSLRLAAAFGVLLLSALLVGGMVGALIGKLIDTTGLTGTDRVLGSLFGFLRGVLILSVLVLLAQATPFPQDPWWQESQMIPHVQEVASRLQQLLPEEVMSYLR